MWFKERGLLNSQHLLGGDLCDHIIRKTTIFTLMMNTIPIQYPYKLQDHEEKWLWPQCEFANHLAPIAESFILTLGKWAHILKYMFVNKPVFTKKTKVSIAPIMNHDL